MTIPRPRTHAGTGGCIVSVEGSASEMVSVSSANSLYTLTQETRGRRDTLLFTHAHGNAEGTRTQAGRSHPFVLHALGVTAALDVCAVPNILHADVFRRPLLPRLPGPAHMQDAVRAWRLLLLVWWLPQRRLAWERRGDGSSSSSGRGGDGGGGGGGRGGCAVVWSYQASLLC
jgi:uncharacterized membrane protein YgcG